MFEYVLNKTVDENAIKIDSTECASSLYAFAKETEKAPADLFSDARYLSYFKVIITNSLGISNLVITLAIRFIHVAADILV